MRRKSLAMLFVTMLILSTVLLVTSPVAAPFAGITCNIDPTEGYVGTEVTVSGIVVPAVGGHTVKIYWDVPFVPANLMATTTTLSDGSYEVTFLVPADTAGDHTVISVDANTGAQCPGAIFTIKPRVVLCCICGEFGDTVGVSGTGFLADSWVEWRIGSYGSGFVAWASGEVKTDETGSWYTNFHVEDVDPGVYIFQARDEEYHDVRAKAEFMVGPLLLLDRDHGQPCEDIDVRGCLPNDWTAAETPGDIYVIGLPLCLYGTETLDVGDITIYPCGYFEGSFHVPEIPTGEYELLATDKEETVSATAWFWVCPCIHIDPVEGQVGDKITVSGNGYAADSEVTVWMSGLLPTGIPLEAIVCFYELVNKVWAWDETDTWLILTVGYFLPVAYAKTDCYGNFEAEFEIPECWGGYHPIVATDDEGNANVIGGWEAFYRCPVFPDGLLLLDRCAMAVNKPGILRVLPKIWTDPACGVSGQTITLYGTGLSSFEFYVRYTDTDHDKCPDLFERCKWEGEIYVYKRCSGFVLDFGPNKRWIDGPYFPDMAYICPQLGTYEWAHFILNGQFDDSWARASWGSSLYPWGRYSPLMLNPRGSLVSDGMSYTITVEVDYTEDPELDFCDRFSCTLDFAWDYRQTGSPFLTVPWLQPQQACLVAYRFDYIEIEFHAQWPGQDVLDLTLEFFTYDYDETATTCFTIECLKVDTDVECPECPQVDLSGIEARLAALEGNVNALKEQLSALDAKITGLITDAEGHIMAKIDTAAGAINLKLDALDAKIVNLDGDLVTIGTAIGDLQVTLDDLNAYITVDLTSKLATIETDIGTLEGKLVSMEGKMATIETDIGTVTDKADLIVNHTGSMPVTIALSLIAAISAIAAAVLILRKVYIA